MWPYHKQLIQYWFHVFSNITCLESGRERERERESSSWKYQINGAKQQNFIDNNKYLSKWSGKFKGIYSRKRNTNRKCSLCSLNASKSVVIIKSWEPRLICISHILDIKKIEQQIRICSRSWNLSLMLEHNFSTFSASNFIVWRIA